jgi:signal transduction histidine kinase
MTETVTNSRASTRADGATGTPAQVSEAWWDRALFGWHLAFVGIAALLAVLYVIDGAPPLSYVLLVALVVWYLVIGRRALPEAEGKVAALYLVGAYGLFCSMVYLEPSSLTMLFILYPQTFALIGRLRTALAVTVGLSALFTVALIAREGWTREATVDGLIQGLINLAFAVLIGVFIMGVIRENERRAALITELEATRAELAEAHHQAGVMAERERLSHEIHDTLAQGFTSMLMLIQAADAAIEANPAAAHHRLSLAEQTARENLAEARALVAALAPVDLQEACLGDAVSRLVRRLGEEMDIGAAVQIEGTPRQLAPGTQVVLLRAAQEALANVRKHAGADAVAVHLRYRDDGTSLEVRDNGQGFDPAREENGSDGFGLRGMRARLEQVGGEMEVNSSAGRGTTVRVMVP